MAGHSKPGKLQQKRLLLERGSPPRIMVGGGTRPLEVVAASTMIELIVSLLCNWMPVVSPREKRYREHGDDHCNGRPDIHVATTMFDMLTLLGSDVSDLMRSWQIDEIRRSVFSSAPPAI